MTKNRKNQSASGKVVKAGAGYILGNYMIKGITFLSAPIFTRLLSTSDFGEYNTYLAYESILYILIGIALHSSINNAKYKYGEAIEEYISSIILLILVNTGLWLLLANVTFEFYHEIFGFDKYIVNLLIIHCLGSSLLQIYNVYVSLSYKVGSFLKITAFNAILNIIISVLLILFFFSGDRGVGRIIGTVVPIYAISIYIVIFFFRKAKPQINFNYWKFGLLYSIPIVPHGISQVILATFDRIMIRDMVGAAEAGIYSFAYTIYALFKVATTSLEKVWKPWIYEKMEQKEYDVIRTRGTDYAFGMALYTVLIIMIAPEIIKILGDKAYWSSTSCVVPVVLGGYFAFMYTLPSIIEYFYGKTRFIALGTVSAALINIGLNYVFIPRYGYIAAAYTTLVTYIIYFVFHYILAKKIHGCQIYDTKKLAFISITILITGGVALMFEKYPLIRWGIELFLLGYAFIWTDRHFDISAKIKSKIGK